MTQDQAATPDTQPETGKEKQDAIVRQYGDLAGALSGPKNGYDVQDLPSQPVPNADYGAPDGWKKVLPAEPQVKSVRVVGDFKPLSSSEPRQEDWEKINLEFQTGSGLWKGSCEIEPGDYKFTVVINNDEDEKYGAGGVKKGTEIPINVPPDRPRVTFFWDRVSHAAPYTFEPPKSQN